MTGSMTGFVLEQILDDYATLVAEKQAVKIDYKIWQKLVRAAKDQTFVKWKTFGSTVEIIIPGEEGEHLYIGSFPLVKIIQKYCAGMLTGIDAADLKGDSSENITTLNCTKYSDLAATATTAWDSLTTAIGTTCLDGVTYNTVSKDVTYKLTPDSIYLKGDTEWLPLSTAGTITTTICEDDKEKENMNTNKMLNFDFGACGDSVRMSMYGLAVKNQAGEWVSYDANSGDIINVDVFNIAEGGKYFWKVPVALSNVAIGDLIIHAKRPCYVVGFSENNGNPIVIDIYNMEQKEILLQKNMFGFNFCTKVVSLFDSMNMADNKPNTNQPFGNFWMLVMMDEKTSMNDMLPFMLMQNGQMDMSNPLMLMMMMDKGNKDNLLPLMFMTMNQKHECKCGGACQH